MQAVQDMLSSRQKRSTEPRVLVDVIDGYPTLDEDKKEATYVVLVHDGRLRGWAQRIYFDIDFSLITASMQFHCSFDQNLILIQFFITMLI